MFRSHLVRSRQLLSHRTVTPILLQHRFVATKAVKKQTPLKQINEELGNGNFTDALKIFNDLPISKRSEKIYNSFILFTLQKRSYADSLKLLKACLDQHNIVPSESVLAIMQANSEAGTLDNQEDIFPGEATPGSLLLEIQNRMPQIKAESNLEELQARYTEQMKEVEAANKIMEELKAMRRRRGKNVKHAKGVHIVSKQSGDADKTTKELRQEPLPIIENP